MGQLCSEQQQDNIIQIQTQIIIYPNDDGLPYQSLELDKDADKYTSFLMNQFNQVLLEKYNHYIKFINIRYNQLMRYRSEDIQSLCVRLIRKGFDSNVTYFIKQEINKNQIKNDYKGSIHEILSKLVKNQYIKEKFEDFSQKDYQVLHVLFLLSWNITQKNMISQDYRFLNQPESNSVKHLILNNTNKQNGEILSPESIKLMVKANLPSVEFIDISNNKIKDQGVQILCTKKFDKLKNICLNNNDITVKGLSHIVNNNWPNTVQYRLNTVKNSEKQADGYTFNVDEIIKPIKNIVKSKLEDVSSLIDEYYEKNQQILLKSLEVLMRLPIEKESQQTKKKSQNLQKKFLQQSKKQPISIQTVILGMKNILSQGTNVVLLQYNTIKSYLTSRFILGGFQDQRIKIRHKIKLKQWNFKDFIDNNQKLLKFKQQYVEYLVKQYNADGKDIIVHKVTEGLIEVWASASPGNFLIRNPNFAKAEKISFVPFFQQLELSPKDFDAKGNYTFPTNNSCNLLSRGGIPYFQPVHGTRFGINVKGLYDNGNDDWLSMKGIKDQWAVGFHGIRSSPNNQVKDIVKSIMSGRQTGQMMRAGKNQAYSNQYSINKPNQLVGDGIYISPYFSTSLLGYGSFFIVNQQNYCIVLQCRFQPESLKCTSRADFWVINKPKDIRPYGIVLFTEQQYKNIVNIEQSLYTMKCQWNLIKPIYEKFRREHNMPIN